LAGQGFNMTVRDIMELTKIIKRRLELGLSFDQSVCSEFENNIRHKNLIFSNGINLVHEFFNVERKMKNSVLSKSVKFIGNNSSINKIFTKIADKGIFF
jgi:2-octaprenyl-6-methoxyphenol hydroxylase